MSSAGPAREAVRAAPEHPIHLPAPNEKCLVLNGLVHGYGLQTFPSYLNPREAQTALGECFVCVHMCSITLDTVNLGVRLGWESSVLSSSPNRRKQKGRGKGEVLAKLRGEGGHAIYRRGHGISISSSSTQVTLQLLEWKLDFKASDMKIDP